MEEYQKIVDELLLKIDRKDYKDSGMTCIRLAVRGIINIDNKYAMVHSAKHGEYKFPGGGMADGEKKEETLIREVREETGLNVIPESIKYIGKAEETRKGLYDDIFDMTSYYYACGVTEEIGKTMLDPHEAEEGYKLEFVTLAQAIKNNEAIYEVEHMPWIERDTIIMRKLWELTEDEYK